MDSPKKRNLKLISLSAFLLFSFLVIVPVYSQDSGKIQIGRDQLLPVHIAALSTAFVLMAIGGTIARYMKKKAKNWLKLHKRFQWTAAIVGLFGITSGIVMVQVTHGIHLRVAHTVVALVSALLIILAIVVAYGFLKGKKYKNQTRIIHRWTGRFTILSFLTTIILGLFTAGIL